MNISEIVKSLTAEREQIDVALTALHKISTLATSNRQALTITTADYRETTGIGMVRPSTPSVHTRAYTRSKRVVTAEERAAMSQRAKDRWATRRAAKKKPAAKVTKPVAAQASAA
jgi:hypothetical protein